MSKIAICSGYFNPLGSHHINYFRAAKNLANKLIVIVNNDKQVELKGSYKFQDQYERLSIVKSIKYVDAAFYAIDDDKSVTKTIEMINLLYYNDDLIFCNGGDRTEETCSSSEEEYCRLVGIELAYNVGGGKVGSSSDTLQEFLDNNWNKAYIHPDYWKVSIPSIKENMRKKYNVISEDGWYSGPAPLHMIEIFKDVNKKS